MKKLFAFWGILLFVTSTMFAQHTVTGTVRNAETGEPLPGAIVQMKATGKGTSAGEGGQFSLYSVSSGIHTISVSFMGFKSTDTTLTISSGLQLDIELQQSTHQLQEVVVTATRAADDNPSTKTNVSRQEIEELNLGQDLPYILQYTPSMVVTSDAGAGIGYTGLRIRGSDQTRINVTVNGIPMNDAEGHGVFWVNISDIASSTENIQIQRGVGTSTNGPGAFGGTVSLQTFNLRQKPYTTLINGIGSFNTRRHTVAAGTGLINDKFAFDGRFSRIASDGYMDRAFSDMHSYYMSGGYYGEKTMVKAIIFGGREQTYQAWYGVPEPRLTGDVAGMQYYIDNLWMNNAEAENLLTSGRTYNPYTYENETDNYGQDHYQLHLTHQLSKKFVVNGALHYTYGRGYYEQFKADRKYANYGLEQPIIGNDTLTSTDIIQRRWLDNHFYGFTFSGEYKASEKLRAVVGGAWNHYNGDHFGELLWMRFAGPNEIRDRWYDNNAIKTDFNIYGKADYQITDKLLAYGDLQYRMVTYQAQGIDVDLSGILEDATYNFVNPKFGLSYELTDKNSVNFFAGVANREPTRNDFIDNAVTPQPETLYNAELGFERKTKKYRFMANYYMMYYQNQLILTGELNDVGAAVRTNVPESYRTGIELVGGVQILRQLRWQGNVTLSMNKITEFTEQITLYDTLFNDFVGESRYTNTDISYSPSVIASSIFDFAPVKWAKISLLTKFVGRQYLDNTQNESRSLDPYLVNDVKIDLLWGRKDWLRQVELSFLVNNVLNQMYSSNGYTFGWGEQVPGESTFVRKDFNYLYPQAGRNYLLNLRVEI